MPHAATMASTSRHITIRRRIARPISTYALTPELARRTTERDRAKRAAGDIPVRAEMGRGRVHVAIAGLQLETIENAGAAASTEQLLHGLARDQRGIAVIAPAADPQLARYLLAGDRRVHGLAQIAA